jgi:NADH-quinone oxidoreductase subunit M
VADAAERGPAIPTALLLNGHFGALLVAKLIVPLFPRTAGNLFPVLSYLAIALYVAIQALAENSPRRLLAFIALSQSACILAGLESRTSEGIAGALVHWFVVTVSTLGLFGLLGTLSFCSQDLLIHGTLMSYPLTGLLLPIATAMNAVSVFRLFTRLFLGKRHTGFTLVADALPRERWILAAGVLFVVLGGLFPGVIVAQRSAEADAVEQAIPSPAPESTWKLPSWRDLIPLS